MKQIEIEIKDWSELYAAFAEFKELECWNWLYDSDLFGVQNPEDKKIGYCCIMGKLGRYKALALYLGTDGLESYLDICNGKTKANTFDPIINQKCLMASLENSNQLDINDLEIISKLNLEFKKDEYPVFRNHSPGYLPWFLSYHDVKFLTIALKQAVNVAKRCKKNKDILESGNKDEFLVRVKKDNNWLDEYIAPPVLEEREIKPIIDQKSFNQLKDLKVEKDVTWEINSLALTTPISEGNDRPYYPNLSAIVDRESHTPLGFEISNYNKLNIKLPALFINMCLESEYLPEKVVLHPNISNLIRPITKNLKIKTVSSKRLKVLDSIADNLISIMMSEQKMM